MLLGLTPKYFAGLSFYLCIPLLLKKMSFQAALSLGPGLFRTYIT